MKGKCLFLGTGASLGVPMVTCDCVVCNSTSSLNKRLRSSVLVSVGGKKFLVDISIDFREMALRYKINHFDGILITHYHQDHVGGIDDLRPFTRFMSRTIPLLLSEKTYDELKLRFPFFIKWFDIEVLKGKYGKGYFQDIPYTFVTYWQDQVQVNGFRWGNFAYLTDIKTFEKEIFTYLDGVKTLVVGSIFREGTHVHFSFDEAIAFARKVGAVKTYFTHMNHYVDHEKEDADLPSNVALAFDGLEVGFEI